jgi:hypothetical protein
LHSPIFDFLTNDDAILISDDQIETLLLRASRLSGIDGLCGMRYKRLFLPPSPNPMPLHNHLLNVIRPLLAFRKVQLRTYCESRDISWVEDPTNARLCFKRNAIREGLTRMQESHRLQTSFDAETSVFGCLLRLLQDFSDARDCADQEVSARILYHTKLCPITGQIAVPLLPLCAAPLTVRKRFLKHALWMVSGHDFPPKTVDVAASLDMLVAGSHTSLCIYGCLIVKGSEHVKIGAQPRTGRYRCVTPISASSSVWWNGRYVVSLEPMAAGATSIDDDTRERERYYVTSLESCWLGHLPESLRHEFTSNQFGVIPIILAAPLGSDISGSSARVVSIPAVGYHEASRILGSAYLFPKYALDHTDSPFVGGHRPRKQQQAVLYPSNIHDVN